MFASLALHAGAFLVLTRGPGILEDFLPSWGRYDPIEVDLTRPYRLTSDPSKAFKSPNPGTGRPMVKEPKPGEFKAGGGVAQQGKDWALPTPATKVLETPNEEGHVLSKSTAPSTGTGLVEGESQGLGGLGTGGEGEVDWVYLTELPRLLNRDELLRNIHRFYPPDERRQGREATVKAQVHLNREGQVARVEIGVTGGPGFDDAAQKILSLARFSPARAGDRIVATKFTFPIEFRLSD